MSESPKAALSPASYPYDYTEAPRDDVLQMIPEDGKVIGSVGCGYGNTEAVLVRQGREVHGVDVNPEVVALAARQITSARTVTPAETALFADDSLDGLILADVLEHLPAAWERLQTLSRSVKPGGWIVISVPNMRNVDALWQYVVRGDWPEAPIGIFDATHIQFMTHKRLERWCAAAGLNVEQRFHAADPRHPRRNRLTQVFNRLTLNTFREFFDFQVQVRCRKSR
jgi:2-polyprenyl-3-methyl-5-hydroxy-6-metoxy-1,4-benzoquinol methylase